MGSVFLLPWTWLEAPISSLRTLGFRTVAMALSDNSVPIDDPSLKEEPQLAIVLGTEGDGLSPQVIQETDYVVRIPMWHEVDSLNVAAASAVAFWELRHYKVIGHLLRSYYILVSPLSNLSVLFHLIYYTIII